MRADEGGRRLDLGRRARPHGEGGAPHPEELPRDRGVQRPEGSARRRDADPDLGSPEAHGLAAGRDQLHDRRQVAPARERDRWLDQGRGRHTDRDLQQHKDDDADGKIDCVDPDCATDPLCIGKENCTNKVDDDKDAKIDCADDDCKADPACITKEICNNSKDDDNDTKIDCVDPDCATDPLCIGKENCTNKVDDDKDAKIDCADDDCKADPACITKEICNNSKDDDNDTKIDCVDPDCATDPLCIGKENCTNKVDDDKDAKIDCADDDCKADPACITKEICNNSKDDDGDAKIDCVDPDCAADPLCAPTECPDYAFIFGPTVTKGTVDLKDAKSYVISMRNTDPSLGFQLGVKATKAGTATNWEFSPTLGADANRLIELIITDDKANSKTPQTPNKATSTTGTVAKVERGAAIEKFANQNDFFAVDLNPGVGGPGFTVGYVADTDGGAGGGNKIPATAKDAKCVTNEILEVTLGQGPVGKFNRGDADGNSKINVVDAILIIQIETGNLPEKFDCDDALDANDDGTVTTQDGIRVLQYVFERGPNLPPPFRTCGDDPTDDSLTCNASNCGG